MEQNFAIQLFEDKKVRFVWDAEREKYYFSIVDVAGSGRVAALLCHHAGAGYQ